MDSRSQRASGTVVDPRASLAMWLRTGRTQKNLTLEDVARITKIQPRILEKLETGNLDGLPADVFVKGFVRSFAKCCGLDEKEAIDRLGAAQSGQATTVAKAFVESMSVRVVQATPSAPLPVVPAIDVVEVVEVASLAPVVNEAPAVEAAPVVDTSSVVDTAPVVEIFDVAPLAPVVEAAPVAETPAPVETKKKRSRKKSASAAPRTSRKKKHAAPAAELAPAVETEPAVDVVVEDAVVETPALAEGSQRISASQIEVVAAEIEATVATSESIETEAVEAIAPETLASLETLHETASTFTAGESADDSTVDSTGVGGTWQPTMPPLSTAPSVPWRRPQLPAQASTYVVPHLVIDDADPESADRDRERAAAREQSRLSFLPPILLDREDRSARQGGLTLAVIILLIAATLTLSYLMRRPSARGDGVTMLDAQSELLG